MNKTLRILLAACLFLAGGALAVTEYFSQVRREQPVYLALDPGTPPKDGRIEVVEFFWYGCPHCYKYEPVLAEWVRKHGDAVTLRRVPVGLHEKQVPHQRLYYTLDALGRLGDLHQASFAHIHRKQQPLSSEAAIARFAQEHRIDPAAWDAAFRSDAVLARARAATALQKSYRVERVPSVVIGGRYMTSPSMVGMSLPYLGQTDEMRYAATEKLMDDLLERVKKERGAF